MKILHKEIVRYPSPLPIAFVLAAALIQRVDGVKAFGAIWLDSSEFRGDDFVDWEWVVNHGNSMSYEVARAYFPQLGNYTYVKE
jgi:hypothetical protein